MPRRTVATLVLLVAGAVSALATDWPQFLGPTRTGVYTGPPLADAWGTAGPKVVWRKQVGQAFAGPAVVQNRVLLFHRVGNEEVLESLDTRTGATTWRYAYPTTYRHEFEAADVLPTMCENVDQFLADHGYGSM